MKYAEKKLLITVTILLMITLSIIAVLAYDNCIKQIELNHIQREIKELQRHNNALFDTDRYLIKQIEDIKQF